MTSPRLTSSHLQSSFARTTRLLSSFAVVATPTFPSGVAETLKGFCLFSLLQIRDRNRVHIVICLILATHAPAEGIILSPDAGVNGPARRHHYFFIRDYKVTCRIGRPHEVHHAMRGINIEVEVDLAAPHVGVRRHRVPVAPGR